MSTVTSRWPSTGLVPFDLSVLSWLPLVPSPIRVEERVDGETYLLRAELPGVDPANDVKIVYRDGALRLQIQRMDERKDKTHTEFRYGSYGRTVSLPEGIDEHSIRATYHDGILEITAAMPEPPSARGPIPIAIEPDGVEPTAAKPADHKPAEHKPAEVKQTEHKPAAKQAVKPAGNGAKQSTTRP